MYFHPTVDSEHDMRLNLSSFEIIPADDPTIQNFISSITMQSPDVISLVPLGSDEEWTATILRHKIRNAYFLKDSESTPERKKYLITVSTVREYKIKQGDLNPCDPKQVDLGKVRAETEVEVS